MSVLSRASYKLKLPPQPAVVDCIAVSAAVQEELFDQGEKLLVQQDVRLSYQPHIFRRYLYLAGTDSRRRSELYAALENSQSQLLWSARGGYGACRIVNADELVRRVQQSEKCLVGFSDVTALHVIWQQAGLCSFYAPNISNLSRLTIPALHAVFDAVLRGKFQALAGKHLCGPKQSSQGILWGGNLTVLASLVGDYLSQPPEPLILVLEDVGERPYRLARSLQQLKRAGFLQRVVGVALGAFTNCEEPQGMLYTSLDVLQELLEPLKIPVLSGLAFGHENDVRPLLLGAWSVLDMVAQQLHFPVEGHVRTAKKLH